MALRLLRAYSSIKTSIKQSFLLTNLNCRAFNLAHIHKPQPQLTTIYPIRFTSFFSKNSAEALWKSVTSVSSAGKNRGRGRNLKARLKDLNKGQSIGRGKINIRWPGLTGPLYRGGLVMKQEKLPEDPDWKARMMKMRKVKQSLRKRVHPLERGWTSAKVGGTNIGPPNPVNDEIFEGFETKVIEHKIVNHMTGNLGRKRSVSSFVITGNKNGLCGIALGRAPEPKIALKKAKNKAGLRLMNVHLYNNHTVLHDFFCQFGSTKIFVSKKPEGFGLVCHRAIKCACEVIGIKDIYAKVEGAMNYQHIIKAFLIGLLKQKTYQQLADEKQLHLVEFRKENHMYPKVVASPSTVRELKDIPSTETLDFKQHVLDNRVVLKKKKYQPFYVRHKSYENKCIKMEYLRNQDKVRIRMLAEHGELRSFLTDEYPEARPQLWKKKNTEEVD